MIDLREKDRRAICDLAEQFLPKGSEIWAYGSRVKGTNHDTSDLDLVVHFPDGQDRMTSLTQRMDFVEALRESNIPIIVQVMAWDAIPDHFKQNIQACYQVFWTAASDNHE